MGTVIKYLSDIRIVIGIAVLVILIIIWFIVNKIQTGNCRKELEELEIRYNNIKSVPLSFKLNKAVAISRVEPEAMQKVAHMKDDFDKAEANLKQIGQELADTEDQIIAGKLKPARQGLKDLEASISLGETQVNALNTFLDSILEKETSQRQEVTELKNRFRQIKDEANRSQAQLSYAWDMIEQNISDIERMFSNFEEWMYASDFEKANAELDSITESVDKLEKMVHSMPDLLEDATGVIPRMSEVVHHSYTEANERGVYLNHLQVEKNLQMINSGLKDDLDLIKSGSDPSGVREHLDDYKKRLTQLSEQVEKESAAHDQCESIVQETTKLYEETEREMAQVQRQFSNLSSRFGLNGMEERIDNAQADMRSVSSRMPKLLEMYEDKSSPSSGIMASMKEINQTLTSISRSLKDMRAEIDSAAGGEDRARKQLVKLQVIMNQMQVKIAKFKLPSISSQYEADMKRADAYITKLNGLINASPLNVQQLNSTLKEAIDFIYRLYNNVNNVVATVIMVENTIVFGNRYRSTYADIDSELTRSELCFRNGDYTQALTIAIATIEKIHPGNYENMIRENSSEA
jgi:septation ring formation regulator